VVKQIAVLAVVETEAINMGCGHTKDEVDHEILIKEIQKLRIQLDEAEMSLKKEREPSSKEGQPADQTFPTEPPESSASSMAAMLKSKGKQIIELASGPVKEQSSEEHKGQAAELIAVRNKVEELTAEKFALHASLEGERGRAKQAEGQEQALRAISEQERLKVAKLEQEIKSLKETSQSSENARLSELERLYEETANTLKQREARIADLELSCRCNVLQREVEATTRQTERLRHDLEESRSEADSLKAGSQLKDSRIAELEGQIVARDLQLSGLGAQLTESVVIEAELRKELETTKAEEKSQEKPDALVASEESTEVVSSEQPLEETEAEGLQQEGEDEEGKEQEDSD
jgi:hypothetical protein